MQCLKRRSSAMNRNIALVRSKNWDQQTNRCQSHINIWRRTAYAQLVVDLLDNAKCRGVYDGGKIGPVESCSLWFSAAPIFDTGHWRSCSERSHCPHITSSSSPQRTELFPEPATRDRRSEGVGRAHTSGLLGRSESLL